MNKGYIVLILLLVLASCKTKKNIKTPAKPPKTTSEKPKINEPKISSKKPTVFEYQSDYIAKYKNIAMREMREYGIPASITLAQGILESGAGRSSLSRQSNNHFGIKCHKDWKGKSVNYDDDKPQECFRRYKNPEDSFIDHSKFLTGKNRYAFLFDYPKDNYIKWAFGLKKAGYATDPKYPKKLIYYIEKYNLGQYDKLVLGNKKQRVQKQPKTTPAPQISPNNSRIKPKISSRIVKREKVSRVKEVSEVKKVAVVDTNKKVLEVKNEATIQDVTVPQTKIEVSKTVENALDNLSDKTEDSAMYHIVQKGDTFYSLSKKYNIDIEELKKINNIVDNNLSIGQKLLIAKKGISYKIHIVEKGDTLYNISKKHNVSVTYLKDLNKLESDSLDLGQELKY